MYKVYLFIINIGLLSLIFPATYAADAASGIGLVADNLMAPVNVFSGFVQSACFVIGGAFLFASIIKYMEHKRSPLMVPISTVVFLIVAGALLVLLPFVYLLTENGIPYFLAK